MNKIDWTKWSAIAEVMSALAIVVTLLYLADQTRELRLQSEQNNLLMRSQTRSEISNSIVDLLLRSANSDFIADQVFPEEIEARGGVETLRFQNYQLATFRLWENIHYQWRNGLYEDPEFEAEKQIWAKNINFPSMKRVFCSYRSALEPSFAAQLSALLETPC